MARTAGHRDLIDDRGDGAELGAWRRRGTPVARRHREGQHLAYGIAVDPKAPRRLALAQTPTWQAWRTRP
jgi:hypothetical protein